MMHCIGDNLKKNLPVVDYAFRPNLELWDASILTRVSIFACQVKISGIISIFVLESQNCGIFIKPIKLIEPLLYQPSFTDLHRHIIVIICLCYGDLFGEVGSWGVINTRRKHMQNESNMEVPSLSDSKFCMKWQHDAKVWRPQNLS